MKPWKRVEPTKIDKISHRTIVTKTFKMPNNQVETFGTIWPEGQEFVASIALTKNNQVIVARMFWVGPEQVMEELPGGYVDEGETLSQAAERELLEETGYRAGKLEYLGKNYKDAYMNATWHTFLATECTLEDASQHGHEAEEHIEVKLISIDQLIENAKTGKMTDTTGVLLAEDKLKELQSNS